MKKRDVVVVGASAGGIEALSEIVAGLPERFPASVFVVVHVPEHATSALPKILARRGNLPAKHPRDGNVFENGLIYVAPPNCHMMVEARTIRVVRGPREHGLRPAVDPLFRSAGLCLKSRVIAVVLSGNLADGTSGPEIIKANGGATLVQDPDEALYSGMIDSRNQCARPRCARSTTPTSSYAIQSGCEDEVVPLAGIAARLTELMGAATICPHQGEWTQGGNSAI